MVTDSALMAEPSKPSVTVFYSWQSDLPNSTNRNFIQRCLERAIKQLGQDDLLKVVPALDRDTQGATGAVDIADEIYGKIDECHTLVADVSIINKGAKINDQPCRPTPNPNVLLELGYAVNRLDWTGVIPVLNLDSGRIEDLPFDLRKRRILPYELPDSAEQSVKDEQRMQLTAALKSELSKLLSTMTRSTDIELFFFDPETESEIGDTLSISTKVFVDLDISLIGDYRESDPPPRQITVGGITIPNLQRYVTPSLEQPNKDYWRELAQFLEASVSTRRIAIGIRNNGQTLLTGVHLTFRIGDSTGVFAREYREDLPSRTYHPSMRIRPAFVAKIPGGVSIKSKTLEIDFGKLRMGESVVSEAFLIGVQDSGTHQIVGRVLTEQFPPQTCQLTITGQVEHHTVSHEKFIEMILDFDEEQRDEEDDD